MFGQAKFIILGVLLFLPGCALQAGGVVGAPENTLESTPYVEQTGENAYGAVPINIGDKGFTVFLSELSGQIEEEQRKKKEAEERNPFRNVPPDESGNVMIVMFHSFIEVFEEGDDTTVTTTLSDFRALLERLYNEGYRTASLSDFISGSIAVQPGCKPVVFTFDDGRRSQFSFIETEDGEIIENPNTAVAAMEQFYEEYPDFGLNGTFFLNLGFAGTFGTVGTLKERLEAVAEKGFELENHSYSHANLAVMRAADEIMEEVGKNSKILNELLPGRSMSVFALPYGNSNKTLREYIEAGSYEGFDYKNKAIMLVGSGPAEPMYLKSSEGLSVKRILASGIVPVDLDFGWWLDAKKHEYISDGDPDTITVPSDKLDLIDEDKVSALGKKLVVLETETAGK